MRHEPEAGAAAQLHVEEDQVVVGLREQGLGLVKGGRFANDPEPAGMSGEGQPQVGARAGFVVHNDGLQHDRLNLGRAGAVRERQAGDHEGALLPDDKRMGAGMVAGEAAPEIFKPDAGGMDPGGRRVPGAAIRDFDHQFVPGRDADCQPELEGAAGGFAAVLDRVFQER
jgi:hypothetical protein